MSENEQFQIWLDKVCARPLPQNPMTRIRILAKELAEGAVGQIWDTALFRVYRSEATPISEALSTYLEKRWNNNFPPTYLLVSNGYLVGIDELHLLRVDKPAFDLLEEAEPTNIFISYKRTESSAFALLVLARLKAAGLEPFLDLALVPGEDWEQGLKNRIGQYDYLIALLGKETLKSEVVLKEIQWALAAGVSLIPVWHNGFKYQASDWNLPPEVETALSQRHTIRVLEESALAYNNAIVELLNRFGITP
ncbi:MAG TPA: toll/interleukin-1 receptor domain-containing protein [Phototrophicaceae bacterium]|nr:toll/interleukin-1 receptor domain-containing protein [Phototrophicaceae bacterium]